MMGVEEVEPRTQLLNTPVPFGGFVTSMKIASQANVIKILAVAPVSM